jgi:hypothetical protein
MGSSRPRCVPIFSHVVFIGFTFLFFVGEFTLKIFVGEFKPTDFMHIINQTLENRGFIVFTNK